MIFELYLPRLFVIVSQLTNSQGLPLTIKELDFHSRIKDEVIP